MQDRTCTRSPLAQVLERITYVLQVHWAMSSKKPHKNPNLMTPNQEKLYLLHIGSCVEPMSGREMIQVRLKETVRRIKTDNGTEFVNQTLREYYEKVGISHETSVARSPQQNELRRHGKNTILAILHGKPSRSILNLKFFCALCYPTNDSENLVKLQTKAEFEFIHWIRTHEESNPEFTILLPDEIIETIHVDFDELTAMASEHSSSGPALHEMTPVSI
ncbi:retrovirus-related pol polyprotein from transposon TNT 1-94 [Tanacetum coccineum]